MRFFALKLQPVQGRIHAICNSRRQRIRPLADRALGDANQPSSRDSCPATHANGVLLSQWFISAHAGEVSILARQQSSIVAFNCGTIKAMSTYGERLGMALDWSGRSGAELARHLGVTKSAVYQVIGGQSAGMSAANSARAAKWLNVDHFWLATGEGASKSTDLSPMALDVAKQFDGAPEAQKKALYALITFAVQLATESAPVEALPAPLPSVERLERP